MSIKTVLTTKYIQNELCKQNIFNVYRLNRSIVVSTQYIHFIYTVRINMSFE